MAKIKTHNFKEAVDAEYHIIIASSANKANNDTNITMGLFKNEAHSGKGLSVEERREKLNNNCLMQYTITMPEFCLNMGEMYSYLEGASTPFDEIGEIDGEQVKIPFFADAKDDNIE